MASPLSFLSLLTFPHRPSFHSFLGDRLPHGSYSRHVLPPTTPLFIPAKSLGCQHGPLRLAAQLRQLRVLARQQGQRRLGHVCVHWRDTPCAVLPGPPARAQHPERPRRRAVCPPQQEREQGGQCCESGACSNLSSIYSEMRVVYSTTSTWTPLNGPPSRSPTTSCTTRARKRRAGASTAARLST